MEQTSQNPVVSIITPITSEREHFLPSLQKMIAKQDYDGDIEQILLWEPGTIGLKRNLACERAKGQVILHMDSDDWYGTDWVSKSVEFLISSEADLVGLAVLYFYDDTSTKAWKYSYPSKGWVYGATMCYWKSFWQTHQFPNIQVGEDTKFCTGARIGAHSNCESYLGRIHAGNTSVKKVENNPFTPCDLPTNSIFLKESNRCQ